MTDPYVAALEETVVRQATALSALGIAVTKACDHLPDGPRRALRDALADATAQVVAASNAFSAATRAR